MTVLERLISNLSRLPGLGVKSASRIAYYILRADKNYVRALTGDMLEIIEKIRNCPVCANYTVELPCSICSDPQRDRSTICVVEEARDVSTIESTGEYHGLYHVLLGAISPIDGIGPDDLRIDKLLSRVKEERTTEVIIATNPTIEGETTAQYIIQRLRALEVKVSKLALGLPVGGDLEYADRLTLARALQGRNRQ